MKRRIVMAWLSDERRRWVSDDGLRCYFSSRGGRGPSQLECYRRLLSEPDVETAGQQFAPFAALAWRMSALLEIARGGWRRYPGAIATVLQIVGQ